MSQIFPKLGALYKTIINDYFKIYSEKVIKHKKSSKKNRINLIKRKMILILSLIY